MSPIVVYMKTYGRCIGAHNFFSHNILCSVKGTALSLKGMKEQNAVQIVRATSRQPPHPDRCAKESSGTLPRTWGSCLRLSPEGSPAVLPNDIPLAGIPEEHQDLSLQ